MQWSTGTGEQQLVNQLLLVDADDGRAPVIRDSRMAAALLSPAGYADTQPTVAIRPPLGRWIDRVSNCCETSHRPPGSAVQLSQFSISSNYLSQGEDSCHELGSTASQAWSAANTGFGFGLSCAWPTTNGWRAKPNPPPMCHAMSCVADQGACCPTPNRPCCAGGQQVLCCCITTQTNLISGYLDSIYGLATQCYMQ